MHVSYAVSTALSQIFEGKTVVRIADGVDDRHTGRNVPSHLRIYFDDGSCVTVSADSEPLRVRVSQED